MVRKWTPSANRRGCLALAVIAVAFLILAIAVSLGWLGQVDTGKPSKLPVLSGNSQ
jgi:hypothetical protein